MKKRILVADDDTSVRSVLTRILEDEGFEVLQARTGRDAVSQLLHNQPNLALLDLKMPDKDGWEAYGLMEKLDPFFPVIVITAFPNQFEHAMRLGVDALMEKPLDVPLLIHTIHTLLAEPERARLDRLTNGSFNTSYLRQ